MSNVMTKTFPMGKKVKCVDNKKDERVVNLTEGNIYKVKEYEMLGYAPVMLMGVVNDKDLLSFYKQERFRSSNEWKGGTK